MESRRELFCGEFAKPRGESHSVPVHALGQQPRQHIVNQAAARGVVGPLFRSRNRIELQDLAEPEPKRTRRVTFQLRRAELMLGTEPLAERLQILSDLQSAFVVCEAACVEPPHVHIDRRQQVLANRMPFGLSEQVREEARPSGPRFGHRHEPEVRRGEGTIDGGDRIELPFVQHRQRDLCEQRANR